jgi:glycosyltransferase involved in cell wall biosynthesis
MKVLQVTPAFYPAHVYGGPIQSMYHLCCHLGRVGCEVRVLTTDANGIDAVLDVEKSEEVRIEDNVHVRYCKRIFRHSVSLLFLRELPIYVKWADVVHLRAVYSFPTIFTLLFCKVLSKPVVWSPHGSLQRWSGSRRQKLKAVWKIICQAVAPRKLILHTTCDQEAKESGERFPKAEIVVIPHGITIPDVVRRVDANGLIRLLYLGLLNPKKGIENLLTACKMLEEQGQISWSLTIAGGGDLYYTDSLRVHIRKLGLRLQEGLPLTSLQEQAADRENGRRRQVQMVGHVIGDVKERLFSNADILVLPSYTENFGMVVVEALAHGVPVIASTGTPWSRLDEMGCGLWVPNNPKSLATAIQRMDRLPLGQMGENGREWMQKEFNWQYRTQQMLSCYQQVVT